MLNQLFWAFMAVALALGVSALYFVGVNVLLDKFLSAAPGETVSPARERLRTTLRPWVFLLPAIILLGVYLVYPVFATTWLSLHDDTGRVWVGGENWARLFGDSQFYESMRNNFLWLLVVPAAATAFGLLIAVLTDRIWWGGIAKSLIFLPMAISFVGASVIWGLVYDFRPGDQQIGILNAIVSGLGGQPLDWLQIPFWNNFFLMVVLIWIQTGFAMVILGAALRGIPEETLEAALMDGAGPVQTFFRIMIPQIFPTILVVWTTITILVLKVFDIVLTMTNGQFDTQVLANFMFDQMFRANDRGYASTVALVIMIAVIPVMVYNIRKANEEMR